VSQSSTVPYPPFYPKPASAFFAALRKTKPEDYIDELKLRALNAAELYRSGSQNLDHQQMRQIHSKLVAAAGEFKAIHDGIKMEDSWPPIKYDTLRLCKQIAFRECDLLTSAQQICIQVLNLKTATLSDIRDVVMRVCAYTEIDDHRTKAAKREAVMTLLGFIPFVDKLLGAGGLFKSVKGLFVRDNVQVREILPLLAELAEVDEATERLEHELGRKGSVSWVAEMEQIGLVAEHRLPELRQVAHSAKKYQDAKWSTDFQRAKDLLRSVSLDDIPA
jgi:hypothetical protein